MDVGWVAHAAFGRADRDLCADLSMPLPASACGPYEMDPDTLPLTSCRSLLERSPGIDYNRSPGYVYNRSPSYAVCEK
jgi:hypothetical protein